MVVYDHISVLSFVIIIMDSLICLTWEGLLWLFMNVITITISLLTQNHNRDNNGPCSQIFLRESVLIIYEFTIIIDHVFNDKNNVLCSQIFLGESVLVHCLAGAHRAGTTGIISLMHFQGLDSGEAIKRAKSRRPIIEPIGDFRTLLSMCDAIPRDASGYFKLT